MAAGDARCCQSWLLRDCSTAPGSSVQLGLLALTFGSSKQPPAGLSRRGSRRDMWLLLCLWSRRQSGHTWCFREAAEPQLQAEGWALSTSESQT